MDTATQPGTWDVVGKNPLYFITYSNFSNWLGSIDLKGTCCTSTFVLVVKIFSSQLLKTLIRSQTRWLELTSFPLPPCRAFSARSSHTVSMYGATVHNSCARAYTPIICAQGLTSAVCCSYKPILFSFNVYIVQNLLCKYAQCKTVTSQHMRNS